ncbi:MAG TPA: carboxypeptidase-like regulatory domain-containing protein [Candidatus Acidoferrales bacterium]|nr:carboxypeptidase-like regulatory domain-containing protein [Candidatus Acidoferrales bacterium]
MSGNVPSCIHVSASVAWLGLCVLLCAIPSVAQSQSQQPPASPGTGAPGSEKPPAQQLPGTSPAATPGTITGTVVDQTGTAIAGASITLTRADDSSNRQTTLSGGYGQFSFANIAPGKFHITIASEGFSPQTCSGVLNPGQLYIVPQITLAVATQVTEVHVVPRSVLAKKQIKVEEKQRVLGVVPNFYVSYVADAASLAPKQKFELAWKTTVDPITFGLTGAVAGVEQSQNEFSGYGQGAAGYGKRYGAAYADALTQTFIGGAILPSLLKQDPRYFYKDGGSRRARILYALATSVICKGDNGRWQANYSGIFGDLASGGISNLYYPENERGATLVFKNGLIEIGATGVSNLIQEFLIPKLTPSLPKHHPGKS